jgi:hypothetical protein
VKWLVVILVAANGFMWFASGLWVPDRDRMVATSRTLPRVSTLKVDVSVADTDARKVDSEEVAEIAATTDAAQTEEKNRAEPVPVPVFQTCVRLGWFETADRARAAYRALGSPGGAHAVREQERALEPLHWIIVPPQPEAQALRLFNDLQRRGIDSYLVTRGENRNAISLGLFQSKAAADRVLEIKKRQNLNAVLAMFPRNQLSYALVFEVARSVDAGDRDRRINDYRDDFEMVEISRCEGIATSPENP